MIFTSHRVTRRSLIASAASLALVSPLHAQDDRLRALIAGSHRSPGNVARDKFRFPAEVIAFFGIKDTDTIVEILPGSGAYWLEILAPYVRDKGRFIAASRDETAPEAYQRDHERLLAKLGANAALYGKVEVTKFLADKHEIAPAGSADHVLTFRNLHNWIDRNEIDGSLRAFHKALKPGGLLGVADHRGRTDLSQEAQMRSGYVRQDFATQLIEKAGFKLEGSSEVKANPKDTKDYPEGVWSLPPTLRQKDVDREKYLAIGESDRFVLKFRKV